MRRLTREEKARQNAQTLRTLIVAGFGTIVWLSGIGAWIAVAYLSH